MSGQPVKTGHAQPPLLSSNLRSLIVSRPQQYGDPCGYRAQIVQITGNMLNRLWAIGTNASRPFPARSPASASPPERSLYYEETARPASPECVEPLDPPMAFYRHRHAHNLGWSHRRIGSWTVISMEDELPGSISLVGCADQPMHPESHWCDKLHHIAHPEPLGIRRRHQHTLAIADTRRHTKAPRPP